MYFHISIAIVKPANPVKNNAINTLILVIANKVGFLIISRIPLIVFIVISVKNLIKSGRSDTISNVKFDNSSNVGIHIKHLCSNSIPASIALVQIPLSLQPFT